MRVVIQKVDEASVCVDNEVINSIDEGLLILVGFTQNDNETIINKMVDKIVNLRILEDEEGKINNSVLKNGLEILSVSQFTLYADVRKGRRPSFTESAPAELASDLYDQFNSKLNEHIPTKTGVFQADMKVSLINDGPMTIIIDSEDMGW